MKNKWDWNFMDLPRKEDLPDWCRPGKARLARWDGGVLELCKNILTGYASYNPPDPDIIHAAANWIDLGGNKSMTDITKSIFSLCTPW